MLSFTGVVGAASGDPAISASALILVVAGSDAACPLQLSAQSAGRIRHYITFCDLKASRALEAGTPMLQASPRKKRKQPSHFQLTNAL